MGRAREPSKVAHIRMEPSAAGFAWSPRAQMQIGDMGQLKTNHHSAAPRVDHAAAADLRDAIEAKLAYVLGKRLETANERDWYQATVLAVRDRVVDIWLRSRAETERWHKKRVYYLSIEFLIGRLLFDTLRNLQLFEPARLALADMGIDLDELR